MYRLALLLLPLLWCSAVKAVQFDVKIKDQREEWVENAVISLHPVGTAPPLPENPPLMIMDQVDKEFVPHVLPVVLGTPVSFPNRDQIRHHVYSIGEVKPFELPLYKGTPTEPVVFDLLGEVSLGCNIHDHMSGYIYVLDTPWFALSNDAGIATLEEVPAGEYELRVWHPRIKRKDSYTRLVTLSNKDDELGVVSINLRRAVKRKPRVHWYDDNY